MNSKANHIIHCCQKMISKSGLKLGFFISFVIRLGRLNNAVSSACVLLLSTMVHTSSPPAFRLPPHVVPRHYDLDIVTDLEPESFTFYGNVCIKLECMQPTNTIKVHARDLTFTTDKLSVKSAEGEELARSFAITKTDIDTENEFFILTLAELLVAGQFYSLHLPFQGELKEDLIGYYRSSYVDHATNTTKWLTVTHFEPSDARQAFPCFDEPAMKATFKIRLAHKENFKSISNMPLNRITPFDGKPGWVWDEYLPTVRMSTYLIAYMVSEFGYVEASPQPNHVQLRVWARQEALQQAEFAAKVGPRFLSFYEDFFNVKYPLPKQDLLAIPDFKISAMENWGIITFREGSLLLDEKSTSSNVKLAIANVIAHELAHMWFGNLVTMRWWTDLWLKEGFATYMAGLNVHNEFPEWNSLDAMALDDLLNVFSLDSLKSSHPVSVPINHPREISQIFDAISYDKGSYLLRMMSLFLGEEVFRHGVSEYLRSHEYGNAEQNDLWGAMTVQAHRYHVLPKELTVNQIMDSWTLQTGYPQITVTRDYETGKATVTQRRFLAVKSSNASDYETRWWVPISYSTAENPQFNKTAPHPDDWLSPQVESITIDVGVGDHWLLVNNRIAGLYRVKYDPGNFALLTVALNSPHYEVIDPLNRAQLLIDALDLADQGEISYNLALRLVAYMRQETSRLAWAATLAKLHPIRTILARTHNFGCFKHFIRWLMTPIVERMGRLTDKRESFEENQLLSEVVAWACPLGIGDCAAQATQLFDQWRQTPDPDDHNPIPKDVRRTVYAHGVKEGGEDAWEFLWERYKNANLSTEKNNILLALTASKEVWLLNRYLEWSLDENSGIRKQDSFIIFSIMAGREVGFYVAHKFFIRNIKRISEYFGPKSSLIRKYVTSLSDQMISKHELADLRQFCSSHATELAPANLAVTQAMEAVQVNINWVDTHFHNISAALTDVARG